MGYCVANFKYFDDNLMETIFCLSAVRASIAQPFRRRDNLNGFFSPDIAKDVKEQSVHSREKRNNSLA